MNAFLFLLILILFPLNSYAQVSFVDPQFDKLTLSDTPGKGHPPDAEIYRYFQWEKSTLSGHIHEADTHLRELSKVCDGWETSQFAAISKTNRARALALCALVRVEEINQVSPVFQIGKAEKILKDIQELEKEKLPSMKEQLWVQARIFSRLPPGYGQSFKQSFFALQSLQRLNPELTATGYSLGEARLIQGNSELAKQAFAETTNARKELIQENYRRIVDGESFGITPRLYIHPESGVTLSVRAFDDRINDTRSNFFLEGALGLRSFYLGSGALRWVQGDVGLELQVSAIRKKDDDYGLGNDSNVNSHTEVLKDRERAGLGARYNVSNAFSVFVGGETEVENSVGHAFALGPALGIAWDSRESRNAPRSGLNVKLDYSANLKTLGSTFNTQIVTLNAETAVPLSNKVTSTSALCLSAAFDEVSYSTLRKSGESCVTPGTRMGRFKDRALYSLWSEIDYHLWGPLTLGAFGSLGSVADAVKNLVSISPYPGAGMMLGWQFTRYRRNDVRLEAAVHGGEFLISVGVGSTL